MISNCRQVISVTGDTTRMIFNSISALKKNCKYVLSTAILMLLLLSLLNTQTSFAALTVDGQEPVRSLQTDYASQFSVDYYENGSRLLSLADGKRFLVLPENAEQPSDIDDNIVILREPVRDIYLAATAAMCLFDALDRLDAVRLSGTKAEGWYIENARAAMEEGRILYAGSYSKPDYELLLEQGCNLAIESQMISHAPEIEEKLKELGIPVLVDLSSNEGHPLGRTEWIRFYGALLGEDEKADRIFSEQEAFLDSVLSEGDTGKTAAFFYITSAGAVTVRKSGDYVSKMIELAGGRYVFDNIGDPEKSTSTVTIEMETFFNTAKDADYIFYNSAISGELSSLDDLLEKNALLAEFKAVREGNVWCTHKNMYQDTIGLGEMIQSFHTIFTSEADQLNELPYLYRLR